MVLQYLDTTHNRNRFIRLTRKGTYGHVESCDTESREWLGTLRRWAAKGTITIGAKPTYDPEFNLEKKLSKIWHPQAYYEDLQPFSPPSIPRSTPPTYSETIKSDHPTLRREETPLQHWTGNRYEQQTRHFLRPSNEATRRRMARNQRRQERQNRKVADQPPRPTSPVRSDNKRRKEAQEMMSGMDIATFDYSKKITDIGQCESWACSPKHHR